MIAMATATTWHCVRLRLSQLQQILHTHQRLFSSSALHYCSTSAAVLSAAIFSAIILIKSSTECTYPLGHSRLIFLKSATTARGIHIVLFAALLLLVLLVLVLVFVGLLWALLRITLTRNLSAAKRVSSHR
jgi:flagellar biosynthesis protein FlhB